MCTFFLRLPRLDLHTNVLPHSVYRWLWLEWRDCLCLSSLFLGVNLVQLPVPLGACSQWYSKWRPENPQISLSPYFNPNPFIPYIVGLASSLPEVFFLSVLIIALLKVIPIHTQNQFEWLPLKWGRQPLKCWWRPPKCWWQPLKWGDDHRNADGILLA